MLETDTLMRAEPLPVGSFEKPWDESCGRVVGPVPQTSTQHDPDFDTEPVICCGTSSGNKSKPLPASRPNTSHTISDDSSGGSCGSPCSSHRSCNTSSPGRYDISSKHNSDTKSHTLCDAARVEKFNTLCRSSPSHEEPRTTSTTATDHSHVSVTQETLETLPMPESHTSIDSCKTSSQCDCDPEPATVVSCDMSSIDDSNTLDDVDSTDKRPKVKSSTGSVDLSDGFSPMAAKVFSDGVPDSCSLGTCVSSVENDSESDPEEERHPMGSQNEAAYASPIRDGQRVRTSCDSIDDTGRWHVDPDGFINEKNRAGGPYLCSLPVKMLGLNGVDPLWTMFQNFKLNGMIISTLTHYKINAISMKIKKCQYDFDPEVQRMPNLLITATRDKFSDDWVNACREVWKHLSDNELGHVNVEIADPAVHSLRPFRVWTIGLCEPLYSVYHDVTSRISTEVDLTGFLSMSGLRVGHSPKRKDSEPFILINVKYQSNKDWRGVREQIVSILDDFNVPMVGVLILKGRMWGGRSGLKGE
ncbi:hypothetical protein N7457_007513 [Penicillium paradoxum]|uniref:uncharacterized protein n=1 Tax=Penicillium paradoxum TaxID=176176 RepID=UPI00254690D2|nr:uncharacterized protein N7457_007513 [Penicillium paradoxum]KAJ5779793.1 hypothetical protein N7457_007513 [Penicillium paradoxum]